jgi:UDP-2,3-diacylglucosamine pyrophosphatase LpxH
MATSSSSEIMKQKLNHFRSIWVSDVHLGTRGCQAELLNNFLKLHSCDTLYLVGDIIDGWRMKKKFFWKESHSLVIRQVINKQRHGSKIIYIAGNHDEFLRPWLEHIAIEGIELVDHYDHIGVDGKKYLVTHGDLFDGVTNLAPWLAVLGDSAYDFLIWLNRHFNRARNLFGLRYWSLSAYLKKNVKKALEFVFDFEDNLASYCESKGYDGVICGHIHFGEIKRIGNIIYMNDSDFVESCGCIVELPSGDFIFQVIHPDNSIHPMKALDIRTGQIFEGDALALWLSQQ